MKWDYDLRSLYWDPPNSSFMEISLCFCRKHYWMESLMWYCPSSSILNKRCQLTYYTVIVRRDNEPRVRTSILRGTKYIDKSKSSKSNKYKDGLKPPGGPKFKLRSGPLLGFNSFYCSGSIFYYLILSGGST